MSPASRIETRQANMVQAIFDERATMFAGAATHAAFYGLSVPLFLACIAIQQRHATQKRRLGKHVTVLLTLMFIVSTVLAACHLQFYRLTLINHADDPSYAGILQTPFHLVNNFCLGFGATLSDALIIWRCYILWNRSWRVISFPALLTVGTLVSTVIWVIDIGQNNSKGFLDFGFVVTSLSVSTNILVTSLIAFRILYTANRMRRVLGKKSVRPYISSFGIVVESAALYSISGVVFMVTFALGSTLEQVTAAIYGPMAAIAAYLVVIRVGLGLDFEQTTIITGKMVFQEASERIGDEYEGMANVRSMKHSHHGLSADSGAIDHSKPIYDVVHIIPEATPISFAEHPPS